MSKSGHHCLCGNVIPKARANIGYTTCMECGDKHAKKVRMGWTIAPMHKSNYMLITNMDDLQGLNNKGGLVR